MMGKKTFAVYEDGFDAEKKAWVSRQHHKKPFERNRGLGTGSRQIISQRLSRSVRIDSRGDALVCTGEVADKL